MICLCRRSPCAVLRRLSRGRTETETGDITARHLGCKRGLQLKGAGVEDERSVAVADTCGLTIVSRLSYTVIQAFPLDQRRG